MFHDIVKAKNFTENHALNSRLFWNLRKDADSNYIPLLLHVSKMVFKRSKFKEIIVNKGRGRNIFNRSKRWTGCFFFEMTYVYPSCFICQTFLRSSTISAYIFNEKMAIYWFTSNDQIESFIKSINIWKSIVKKNVFDVLSIVDNFIIKKIHCEKIIVDHLKALKLQLRVLY